MSLALHEIAEAFCRYRYGETYPYMADDIRWNILGHAELIGRAAVIARCDQAAQFLTTVSATITKLKIHRAENFVVVEGAAHFHYQDNQTSRAASCDVFQFSEGRLVELTSYNVELEQP